MIYGYVRVSTEQQNTEQQKDEIMHYAEKEGFAIDDFIAITISSKKTQKERRIRELLDKVKEGDTIVVVELSRLGRSIIEVLQLIEEITKKGVRLEFIRQPFLNTSESNPFQKVILSMFAAFAEAERDLISMRTKAGLEKARKSKVLGPPPGPRRSKFDREKKKILSLVDRGLSSADIAKILGVSPTSLRRWAKNRNISLKSDYKQRMVEKYAQK